MFVRSVVPASFAFFLAACGAGGGKTVVIGVTGPFSQPRGASMKNAVELARDEINRAGGVGGRPIELVFADDSASNDAAVRIANQFQADKRIVAVIGSVTSGPTLAAAGVYSDPAHPLALISPSASAPALTEDGGAAVFRVCPTDFAHGQALARYARNVLHAQRAEILYENAVYGRGVAANFAGDFTSLGGTIVKEDPYNAQISSFKPYLQRLQLVGGADVILIAGQRDGAERIIATLDSLKIGAKVLAGDAVVGIEAGGHAEGMFVSSAWLADRADPTSQHFVAAYRAAEGGATPDHRAAGGYDIVHILARAVAAVGSDRAKVIDYLGGIGTATPAYDGVTGRIIFDENGDAKDKAVAVGVIRNKQIVTAADR